MSQTSERAVQRPLLGIVLFCLAQLLLTYGVLWWLVYYTAFRWSHSGISLIVGVGDVQLGLSGVLLGGRIFRWSVRWPLALVLLFSGWAVHYVSLLIFDFPIWCGEQLLVPPLLVVALAIAIRLSPMRSESASNCLKSDYPFARRLQLADLFSWILAVALCLTISKKVMSFADVSEIFSSEGPFDLMIRYEPTMVLMRMPLLLAAIIAQLAAWILIARLVLTRHRLTLARLLGVAGVLCSLSAIELALGFGTLLFDYLWAVFPVSTDLSLVFAAYVFEWSPETSTITAARGIDLLGLLITRLFVFGGSLLILRWGGVRLAPAIATSGKSSDGVS